ncbi:MAG: FAD-dependent oxidoreductase [Candidatus Eremiobacteraeota bacterium]|nr:FAD-dependent oxidoreductase [Candidatus Eremiobacteraeota bacterium]MBV8721986.1 FAD-dependent oxidoreductase [Candidatus Eremiobacteraeota bacterium]
MQYERLFSAVPLGSRTAKNRIVSTPHGTNLAVAGVPSPELIAYHAAKAAGGCGTVMMFGSAAVSELTPIFSNHVNLWRDDVEPGLRAGAEAVHAHGALAFSQMTSLGRRTFAQVDLTGRGPSDTSGEVAPEIPHVLTIREIRRIVRDYGRSAKRLADCGFDGCDLAFYAEQLPDQMWNPAINKRTDRYGGSLENRMRFSLEVLEAIRAEVGREFVVGARVSGDDRMTPGIARDELLEIIARLDRTGMLDYFTVTGGTIEGYASRGYNIPSAYYPKKTFVDLAQLVRERVGATLILTGRITTPDDAEAVLASGVADLVGMTRAMIADNEMPRKAQEGRAGEIRTCLGSNEGCIDRLYFGLPVRCVQNAVIGRELEWSALQPAERRKRIAVIGGGPAGMESARIAAQRGHSVTLYEREDELGGAIRIASRAPQWENYRSIVDWLAAELDRRGVAVRLQRTIAPSDFESLDADAVVFATGAVARTPYVEIDEAANVCTVGDVLAGRARLRGRCVVLDETGYTPGPKAADALADAGHEVEIVTRLYSLGETIGITLRAPLYERLLRKNVEITPLHAAVRVTGRGVVLRHVLTGTERTVKADTVVFSSSGRGDDALYEAYVERYGEDAAFLIGDAFAPRRLRTAIAEGAATGRAL